MNGLALGILIVYLAWALLEHGLDALNRKQLRKAGTAAPAMLQGQADPELLQRTRTYTLAKHHVATLGALIGQAATLLLFYGGLLRWLDAWVAAWRLPFVLSTSVFFLLIFLAQTCLFLPLNWYRQFHLEARFGFNTMTPGLWLLDAAKALLLGLLLLFPVSAAGAWLAARFPATWWLWVWGLGALLAWLLMIAGPLWLQPLFNRFVPLPEGSLKAEIKALLERAGIRAEKVFSMDASRRSRHTNAYFTGMGRVKRIVLFDTLLGKLSQPEILAVLAHEAGHWRMRHLPKRWMVSLLLGGAACFLAFHLTRSQALAAAFGLPDAAFAARIALAGLALHVLSFPLNPWLLAWSRRQELAADRFAAGLTGGPDNLTHALLKLFRDNLSNWTPHPWYAAFHYSHPPLVERLEKLAEGEKGNGPVAKKGV